MVAEALVASSGGHCFASGTGEIRDLFMIGSRTYYYTVESYLIILLYFTATCSIFSHWKIIH